MFRSNTFRLGKVEKAPVVIFIDQDTAMLARHLVRHHRYAVLDARVRTHVVTPGILTGMAWDLIRHALVHFARTGGPGGLAAAVRSRLLEAYYAAYVREVGAKVVLTHVDNSVAFHRLARSCPRRLFIAIQNGIRTDRIARRLADDLAEPGRPPLIRTFFGLGPSTIEQYRRHGIVFEQVFLHGSLRAGIHRRTDPEKPAPCLYDICLISHWKAIFYRPDAQQDDPAYAANRRRAIEVVNDYLRRYLAERVLRLGIALRSADPAEMAFYRQWFGDAVTLVPQDDDRLSSYRTVERSDVTVGQYSTILYEALGLGRKTLIMNTSDDRQLDPPAHGIWSVPHDAGYEDFRDALDRVRGMTAAEFFAEVGPFARSVMSFDDDVPLQDVIARLIDERVAAAA